MNEKFKTEFPQEKLYLMSRNSLEYYLEMWRELLNHIYFGPEYYTRELQERLIDKYDCEISTLDFYFSDSKSEDLKERLKAKYEYEIPILENELKKRELRSKEEALSYINEFFKYLESFNIIERLRYINAYVLCGMVTSFDTSNEIKIEIFNIFYSKINELESKMIQDKTLKRKEVSETRKQNKELKEEIMEQIKILTND